MKALPLLALLPFVPVRVALTGFSIFALWLLAVLIVTAFFRALSRLNERL